MFSEIAKRAEGMKSEETWKWKFMIYICEAVA